MFMRLLVILTCHIFFTIVACIKYLKLVLLITCIIFAFFQYDLYCGTEIYTLLTTSLFFIGWAIGAVVLGMASDK